MNGHDVAVGAVVASAAGVGFAWTHGAWYGVFATTPLVDLFGSLLLGVVGGLVCLLAGALAAGCAARWSRVASRPADSPTSS